MTEAQLIALARERGGTVGPSAAETMPKAAKRVGKLKASDGVLFLAACKAHGLPRPYAEFRFHLVRRWLFDWAWTFEKVALEIEGGAWTQGRHTRGKGFTDDITKYNEAVILGWKIIRCTPQDVTTGKVFAWLRRALTPSTGA
jgi:hypothetical protein